LAARTAAQGGDYITVDTAGMTEPCNAPLDKYQLANDGVGTATAKLRLLVGKASAT
jgi:hypothetical protein